VRLIHPSEFLKPESTSTENLIEVYKKCLLIQDLCVKKRISSLSALQVGLPWMLSVCCMKPNDWRYFFNYSYTPLSIEKKPTLIRFVNVEAENARYFMVQRFEKVEYRTHELIVNAQPEIVEHVGVDQTIGLFIQNECELYAGFLPNIEGTEYWIRK
jgi:hypothetical protein